jgi:hypothetical protein
VLIWQLSRVFGTWPTALLLANRKRVIIEGPVCDSSKVIGWHLRNMNNETITSPIHISSFAFNSSILWDPERWGRTSSVKDTSQVNITISFTHHDLYYLNYFLLKINFQLVSI